MSSKIPGIVTPIERENLDSLIELPFSFYADVVDIGVILYAGRRMEAFVIPEGPITDPSGGERVRCLFVRATQQVYIVEATT
ncbi:hypothetical protein LCGC14_0313540 [marine sediment metagenome]|uniref:Uncharacterized protein n=1 Tax=marine sediment metagenome TaxID=412755 RepID=A0A0F9U451_9ZZZZ